MKKHIITSLCIALLSSGSYAMSTEEREFDSAGIRSLNIRIDGGRVDISPSEGEKSTVAYARQSGEGEISIELEGEELNIRGINPPKGGCITDYVISVPQETPVTIRTGKSKVTIDEMGDLDIHAGTLELYAQRLRGAASLQFATGEADLYYSLMPTYSRILNFNSVKGKIMVELPEDASVKIQSTRPEKITSDFISSFGGIFSIKYNTVSGNLNLKKRNS